MPTLISTPKPTEDQQERVCTTCGKMLPVDVKGVQSGFYCCDDYFCSQACLNISFKAEPDDDSRWELHYQEGGGDDGDCYYTEWEE